MQTHDHVGRYLVPFFATAMGMLAANSPLRNLRFEDCTLSIDVMPQLHYLSNCTSIHLHEIHSGPDPYLQLNALCQVCWAVDLQPTSGARLCDSCKRSRTYSRVHLIYEFYL